MTKILIIQDNKQMTKKMRLEGFELEYSTSFKDAWLKICSAKSYDLLLMDIELPDGNGIDLCQKVRISGNDIPIVFFSEFCDEATVLRCIRSGANDYLRKPLGFEELKLRINRIIKIMPSPVQLIRFGELIIDPCKRKVTLMGKVLIMGRKEINILILLAKRAGEIVSRETIIEALYDHPDLVDRTIDSHISHLRKKITYAEGKSLKISSIYGLGYRLDWCT